ncbi:MAG: SUF system NifU family Fe-S cluster assembly protein, partial [Bifidobacteriaceae bacterium]|nr:SUF system NifU family Fe-S cluster assembly protein [Bifidobacteriaceae bacterium]
MSSLNDLYQQLIIDHSRDPYGRVSLFDAAAFTGESFQVNPVCGDQIRLRVVTETTNAAPQLKTVRWEGRGCAISQAAASMMSELVEGKTLEQAANLEAQFVQLMHSRGAELPDSTAAALGDAMAFAGVSQYPARVKCALLGWMALR